MISILRRIKNKFLRVLKKRKRDYNPVHKIEEVNYNWAQQLDCNFKPSMIVYHHTAEDNLTPEEIDKKHKDRCWAGIGYHFYIRKNGTIYRGRPENAVGAHAPGVNDKAFGIALEGNFNNEEMNEKQKKSLIELSRYLMLKYNIKDLKRHKDVRDTECPGKNFPFEKIKAALGV